ncbi:MAG TPA: ATP-binding protein [Candidatus Binatia bacterium]|nr:ATP-binding protein [Candidatus Binatia bacterium]
MESPSLTPSHEASIKAEEAKRRKREGIVIAVAALMVAALIFFEVQSPDISLENSLGSNIVFFFIININIILLVLLVFLVVRNLVKLVFERRRRLLGSRLQSRLVLAFVALSIVPSLLLFAIAGGLLTHSFDRWFDAKVESALQGSLEIGQTYYQNSANNAMFFARKLSEKITEDKLFETARLTELRRLVAEKQREYNLGTVEIYSAESEAIVAVSAKSKSAGIDLKPDGEFLARALRGVGVTWTQPLGEGDVIRGGAPIFGPQKRIVGVAVVDYHVPKSLTNRAKQISESYEQYKYLTFLKAPVKNSYILTLFLITLVIMFSATWWGFYLSKGITVPIQKLAEGTHEVAQGNWDYKIETSGDDEIGVLVQSFNQMTGDLKQITLELERRGKVVQTLLANIAAGVVSVDPAGKITTWNKAAEQMLGVKSEQVLAKNYREVLQSEPLRVVAEIIDSVEDREKIEREIKIAQHEQQLTAVVTAATLRDDDGSALGVMVFLEDITQIQKVQRMEAWREVARRIAHEIKNPLTPIQLSAERLRKRYASLLGGDGGILDKCTTTIIQQVEELKSLVNEFSQFARLPSAKLATHDLNEIVNEALFLFNEGHKGIQFQFKPGVIPTLDLDRDQIKRVLINLLDNAVAAVSNNGEVKLSTLYDRGRGVVTLEVTDNGSGLAPEMRTKIFEPYFSTKENGTGLGLTIVSQIIEDHRGYIRALPNEPKGTRFSIELPTAEVAKRAAHS